MATPKKLLGLPKKLPKMDPTRKATPKKLVGISDRKKSPRIIVGIKIKL